MADNETIKIIMDSITELPKITLENELNEWINLAQLGPSLLKNGIDFRKLGYEKLKEFLASFSPQLLLKTYAPDDKTIPVTYVKISHYNNHQPKTLNLTVTKESTNSSNLFDWAYLVDFEKALRKLQDIALPERWDFENSDRGKPLPILRNYLRYTFERLHVEKKIAYSDDNEYAVFNTGLVNKLYSSIYALFSRNKNAGKQLWFFIDFAVEGEDRAGKTLVNKFRILPNPAEYFSDITDVYYDVKMSEPILDTQHILVERAERLPIKFLKSFGPNNFSYQDYNSLPLDKKDEYAKSLKEALKKDVDALRRMQNKMDSAVKLAIKRVRWNYKTAIPMYYPKRQKMHLLLPLCLGNDQTVDTSLVVSKEASGRYQGQTIYPLDWAYKYARLICRPDSDWLYVESINSVQEEKE